MKKLGASIRNNRLLTAVLAIYAVVFAMDPAKGLTAFKISSLTLLSVAAIVASVFVFLGLFQVWVKEETIVKHLGQESGVKGLALGALVGTAINGPLFSIFPLIKALMRKGARFGVIAVIVSTFAIKVPMLPLEVRFLGWKITLIHNLLMFASAFLMAPLMEWLMGRSAREELLEAIEETG